MGPQTAIAKDAFQIPEQPNYGENLGDILNSSPDTDPIIVPLTDAERAIFNSMVNPVDEAREVAVSKDAYFMESGIKAVNPPYVAQKFGEMIDPTWVEGQLPPEAAAYFNTVSSKEPVNSYVDALAGDRQMHSEAYDMAVSSASYSEKKATNERVSTPKEISRLSQAVVAWRKDALGRQDPGTINTLRTK